MSNYDDLSNLAGLPGVIHKRFCSICSLNEATGTIDVFIDETKTETFPLPVCEPCVNKALDKQKESMLD